MPITFENERDVIIFAFEKVISYAKTTQQIFVAHCVWWLASLIRLQQGLINYINLIEGRRNTLGSYQQISEQEVSSTSSDFQADKRNQRILDQADQFVKQSKVSRNTLGGLGRVNSLPATKTQLKKARKERNSSRTTLGAKKISKVAATNKKEDYTKTEGISNSERARRKVAGECLRCAWPSSIKESHQVKDCIRPIKLDKGTAKYPEAK